MEDLNWNDYFDNDREAGGSYEAPDDFEENMAKAKAYMAKKLQAKD